jgi:hypothetical protein
MRCLGAAEADWYRHRSLSCPSGPTALLRWRTFRYAFQCVMLAIAMAVSVSLAAVPVSADTVRLGPVVVLPHSAITIPVPAPPSNADADAASVGDVITQRYNNLRTGTTLNGGLDQRAVSDGRFGLLTALDVDGVVLAQPLFMAGVDFPQGGRSAVFIATSTNWVYAFDADPPFEKLWERHLGEPYRIVDPWNDANPEKKNCPTLMAATLQDDLARPQVVVMGIESTPVIDPLRQRIFVSYRKMDGIPGGTQHIAALNLRTGQFAKAADGHDLDRRVTDNPLWNQVHRNRASLLLDGGYVYVAFSGRCEDPTTPFFNTHSYQGWIYSFDTDGLAFAGRYRSTQQLDGAPPGDPTGESISGGGIWQASTGLAADGHGNLFFATGNASKGVGPPDMLGKNLSNSIVRLHVDPFAGRPPGSTPISMTPVDWFTPYRKTWLDVLDLDFASAGVVLIPNTRYLVAGGKEGVLYVLDRDNLGKFDDGTPFDRGPMLGHGYTSEDPIALDDSGRDQVVQKFRGGENQYCAAGKNPVFCLGQGQHYVPRPSGSPDDRGVTVDDWLPWPHIHGTPVFGAFPDGRAFLYLWTEKDFLKSFRWWGKRFDTTPIVATKLDTNEPVLAPPYLGDSLVTGAVGMPGGMLALSIDPAQPSGGVLFASVQRCRRLDNDPALHECSVPRCRDSSNCAQQRFGMLRAFDPFTLRELWNNQIDSFANEGDKEYYFAKFVPPTIVQGRVFLATGSRRVLVYGRH